MDSKITKTEQEEQEQNLFWWLQNRFSWRTFVWKTCFLRWGWNDPKQKPAFVLGSHNPQTEICFVSVLSSRCGACFGFIDAFLFLVFNAKTKTRLFRDC